MKRSLLLLAASLALAACGEDLPGQNSNSQSPKEVWDGSWSTVIDPETSRTFRCYSYFQDAGYAGGPALWCYEV